ncbi:hypothetical protein FRACYDRAFT_235575 [Fragilariopsis cylindrus CCMP1102]|uniref:Uncharacterized protein n=1 Tax=Fragilariopsis cylindrus CCMP1102 TaxID=635003 RepID=A0A1E7FMZ2_9STRA|nr:hypothetical protein FRACYDRAFT_235575 [Fragilariopsis cylindrus CCMP1102]|eukprot:OEU19517.1 hypothetical protein FRACYDRAFT_235575 [Fragilariopsis cylindrus CCMP1102]
MIPSSPKTFHRQIQSTRRSGANYVRSVIPTDGGAIEHYKRRGNYPHLCRHRFHRRPDLRSSQQRHAHQHNRIINSSNNKTTSDCCHRDTTSLLKFSSASALKRVSAKVTKDKVHNKPRSNHNKIYVRIKRRAQHRKTTTPANNRPPLCAVIPDTITLRKSNVLSLCTDPPNSAIATATSEKDMSTENDDASFVDEVLNKEANESSYSVPADTTVGLKENNSNDDDTIWNDADDDGENNNEDNNNGDDHPYASLYPELTDVVGDDGVDDSDHPYKSLYPTPIIMNSNNLDLVSGLVGAAEEGKHPSPVTTDQRVVMTRNLLVSMDDDNGPLSWKSVSLIHPPPDSFVLYLANEILCQVESYLKEHPDRCYWIKYTDFWNELFSKTLHNHNYDDVLGIGSLSSSIMLSYRDYIQKLYTNFTKHFNDKVLIDYRIGTNNQILFLRACILFASSQHQHQNQPTQNQQHQQQQQV